MVMPTLLHVVGVAVFGACTYYETYHLLDNSRHVQHHPMVNELFHVDGHHGGRWKFLTVWGLTVQLIYYVIALLNDALGSSTVVRQDVRRLQWLRDTFFMALALPMALLVCLMFWAMYAIDRELVFPPVMDAFYPAALNHGVHTAPLVLALAELLAAPHHSAGDRLSLALLTPLLAAYLTWTMYLAISRGVWVYGVMRVLNWPLRIAFMAANMAVAFGLYLLGTRLDHAVWGAEKAAVCETKGGKKRM